MSDPKDEVPAILADIGGTNARFALLEGNRIGDVLRLNVADHGSAYDALTTALDQFGIQKTPPSAVLAFAGPVSPDCAFMTNTGWETRREDLTRRFGFTNVQLMNDYAALALGLDQLTEQDRRRIGPDLRTSRGTLAVVGPGSGLGVAALIPTPSQGFVLVGEGGHTTVPTTNKLESDLVAILRDRFTHVSAERVLSGPGLVNIHTALGRLEGLQAEPISAAEITRHGLDGSDALCHRALENFCSFLGSFAGNMALSYGAQGGVYLGGGILPRFPEFLEASRFRDCFENKGRLSSYLSQIPTWLITRPDAAFAGLAVAARQLD
ncbi:glucokinase [Pelagibius litoralis]|uniref:Glucokinase n=1 Tax=Pelagibius litoralis TaxID=374515 RepID=A0A967EZH5_9PROT|nr:glucokinase [Pelagibius litoralis]NIA70239.1 glucokinase [Pelagibius litoralis]